MSVKESHGSQLVYEDEIRKLKDVNENNANDPHLMGATGAIFLPLAKGNAVFHITNTTLQLFQSEGTFGGLAHKDPHEHIRKFGYVCEFFSFKNISQESVRLRLFLLYLMGEACKWMAEFPRESMTLWEDLDITFHVVFPFFEDNAFSG